MVFAGLAPEWVLLIGIAAGGAIELAILLVVGRRVIAKRNRIEAVKSLTAGEWDKALAHAFEPLRRDLEAHVEAVSEGAETRLSTALSDFEARFTTAYSEDMASIAEDLGTQTESLKAWARGQQGLEEKAFRKMVGEAELEVENELGMMELAAAEDPEMVFRQVAARLQRLGTDEEWQKAHPWGALIVEAGKPMALDWLRTMTYQMSGRRTPRIAAGGRETEGGGAYRVTPAVKR